MKSLIVRAMALLFLLGAWGTAAADSVRVVWICQINEGQTIDDVRAANSAWVRFMHANVDDGISSSILTPIMGNTTPGRFIYADDFPDQAVWAESQAAEATDAAASILQGLGESATCDSGSMYSVEDS